MFRPAINELSSSTPPNDKTSKLKTTRLPVLPVEEGKRLLAITQAVAHAKDEEAGVRADTPLSFRERGRG